MSIILSAMHFGEVSENIINTQCGKLEGIFASLSYYGILGEDDAQCFRIETTVEEASLILVAASFSLGMLNHFVSGASMQKTRHRWLPSKDKDEGGSLYLMDPRGQCKLPVRPQFTDYYFFAITRIIEAHSQKKGADSSMDEFESNSNEMMHCLTDTAVSKMYNFYGFRKHSTIVSGEHFLDTTIQSRDRPISQQYLEYIVFLVVVVERGYNIMSKPGRNVTKNRKT